MIPKTLHYVFGMASDSGGKPWSLVHYACVKSAIERIKPKDVLFYCEYEPRGPWWELTRSMVDLHKIQGPREIFGNPLVHPAHRADVVRLERLIDSGGIYLDADVFVHRSFDDLLSNSVVLGKQVLNKVDFGLCNAVILSEPHSPFLTRWLAEYRNFRSQGRDEFWDEHSVRIPLWLARQFPEELTIMPHRSFFWPTFQPEDVELMYDSTAEADVSSTFATHLWESVVWERYLEFLTPVRVRSIDSNFHRWVRPFVASLPNDLGGPGIRDRLVLAARAIRGQIRSVMPAWVVQLKHQLTRN